MSAAIIREVSPADLSKLHDLIVSSTNGRTKITKTQLHEDLFSILKPIHGYNESQKLDKSQMISNRPVCRAMIAELPEGVALGYVLFNYFYSPWKTRYVNLVDIYTCLEHRRKGVATHLLNRLVELCAKEGYTDLLCNTTSLSESQREYIQKFSPKILRNDDTDWSVFRIEFVNITSAL